MDLGRASTRRRPSSTDHDDTTATMVKDSAIHSISGSLGGCVAMYVQLHPPPIPPSPARPRNASSRARSLPWRELRTQ